MFQDAGELVTLRRVVNERAGDAFDVLPPGAQPRRNGSPDVLLGRGPASERFTTGFCFRDVYVPPGATILSAKLLLTTTAAVQAAPLDLAIFGEAADNAAPYEFNSMPGIRARTLASVPWSVAGRWNPNTVVATPDVRPLVQEILARPGWHAGNSLALLVLDVGSGGGRAVRAFDFEGYANLPGTPAEFRHFRRHRFAKLELEFVDPQASLVLERELGGANDDADGCVNCNEVNFGFNGTPLIGGFRFPNVRVPPGATITGARLWLPTDGTYTNQIQVALRGEKLINAPSYSPGSLPAPRPKTIATVNWPITQTWNFQEWHPTPEIVGPVTEVLSMPGWIPGNALAIDVLDAGSLVSRRVWGFDRDPRASPHDFPELGATPFVPFRDHPIGQ